ncbi:MAG: nucleoside monophosphate kinase [Parcubacteria group bacterium]
MVNTFVFMGLPGAGKGKQSELLHSKTGFFIHSTGNEYRKMASAIGFVAEKIAQVMNKGGLQPAWLSSYLFQKSLLELDRETGIIFEGVGRKEPEAKLFTEVCEWLERDFRIINLIVSEETAKERLNKRKEIEGRNDDNPEILSERFRNYYESTAPALEYFRSVGKVIDIDGEPLPDEVSAQVSEKISDI